MAQTKIAQAAQESPELVRDVAMIDVKLLGP